MSSANASCPRCGQAFHCGAADTEPCPCGTFTLSAATTQALRAQFNSCLCMRCLAQLQITPQIPTHITDKKKPAQS
ncbi:MAG: cysteine-rich CWC family protein [Cytophagales bacterium]|nr:cysteine-rich CWC family protein [Rhizobacter sp.]